MTAFPLKAQYVICYIYVFAARGRVFKTNKETKAQLDDAVTECGIMRVFIFIPTADAIRQDSGRNYVHG